MSPGPVYFEGGNWETIKNNMAAFYDATVAKMPLKRLGEPREIANTIAFLASPAASLITGANVVTTDNSDWATNCPEYKVTAVEVTPNLHGPAESVAGRADAEATVSG